MAKLRNLPKAVQKVSSPVKSGPAATTYNGAVGVVRDPQSELYLLAVANMVGEDTFYEAATDRDQRFRELVHAVAKTNPAWLAGFLPYLRNEMNMRTASIVMAAEYAIARKGIHDVSAPSTRAVIASALQRADEPAEFVAYWKHRTGKATLPGGVQRGVADAVQRLYTEFNALKYDGNSSAWRMGDVIELTHPTPKDAAQGDLFRYLLDRRHNPSEIRASLDNLPMIAANIAANALPVEQRRGVLTPEFLRTAGMTWESLSGWLQGPMDAEAWEAIIPTMGYMALLRNMRNFDQAGISREARKQVIDKITAEEQVARSRQFPMRFLSAYKATQGSTNYTSAIGEALDLSLQNVPVLPGKTLILVDLSGSMYSRFSARSELQMWEAAAVFGAALALRCESATLVAFGSSSHLVPFNKGESVLPLVQKFGNGLGGTSTKAAVQKHYKDHDRVIVLTDEQYNGTYTNSYTSYSGDPQSVVPADKWFYTFNLAGYKVGQGSSGEGTRHTFGGLSDKAFKIIPMLEAGVNQTWPWE